MIFKIFFACLWIVGENSCPRQAQDLVAVGGLWGENDWNVHQIYMKSLTLSRTSLRKNPILYSINNPLIDSIKNKSNSRVTYQIIHKHTNMSWMCLFLFSSSPWWVNLRSLVKLDGPQHQHRAAVRDVPVTSASGAGRWGTKKRSEGDLKQQDRRGHETVRRTNTLICHGSLHLNHNCGLSFFLTQYSQRRRCGQRESSGCVGWCVCVCVCVCVFLMRNTTF